MIHPVDALAATWARVGPSRVFESGWGDESGLALMDPEFIGDVGPVDIAWGSSECIDGLRRNLGVFRSPVERWLPEQARTVHFETWEPRTGADRMAILLPAWNEHGAATRRRLAHLLCEVGVGSIIFDAPYLGARRVYAPDRHPVASVADFARMGVGAVGDAKALLDTLAPRHLMGVSGYSMGGNLAALVAALSSRPVAVAPLAASPSPGPVFSDAVLSRTIDWRALGDGDVRRRLRTTLDKASVLGIPPPPWAHAAVLAAGRRDGFVPSSLSASLAEHWTGAELRLTGDGHATLARRGRLLATAVSDAFDRLYGA